MSEIENPPAFQNWTCSTEQQPSRLALIQEANDTLRNLVSHASPYSQPAEERIKDLYNFIYYQLHEFAKELDAAKPDSSLSRVLTRAEQICVGGEKAEEKAGK